MTALPRDCRHVHFGQEHGKLWVKCYLLSSLNYGNYDMAWTQHNCASSWSLFVFFSVDGIITGHWNFCWSYCWDWFSMFLICKGCWYRSTCIYHLVCTVTEKKHWLLRQMAFIQMLSECEVHVRSSLSGFQIYKTNWHGFSRCLTEYWSTTEVKSSKKRTWQLSALKN